MGGGGMRFGLLVVGDGSVGVEGSVDAELGPASGRVELIFAALDVREVLILNSYGFKTSFWVALSALKRTVSILSQSSENDYI